MPNTNDNVGRFVDAAEELVRNHVVAEQVPMRVLTWMTCDTGGDARASVLIRVSDLRWQIKVSKVSVKELGWVTVFERSEFRGDDPELEKMAVGLDELQVFLDV